MSKPFVLNKIDDLTFKITYIGPMAYDGTVSVDAEVYDGNECIDKVGSIVQYDELRDRAAVKNHLVTSIKSKISFIKVGDLI